MWWALISFGIVLGVQFIAPPIVMAADLEAIQTRGHLVVAVKDNWSPLGFRNDQGALVGLEIDLARGLADAILGDPNAVVFQPVTNRERLSQVVEDEVDLAIAGVTMTPSRMRLVSFSVPYYLDGTTLITRHPALQRLEDFSPGARISVLEGSSAIAYLRYLLPTATLIGVNSYQEALTQLDTGQTDAFAGDLTVLSGWIQNYSGYHLISEVLSAAPLAIVIPKGVQYDTLRRLVNDTLAEWHENGWLEERASYWGLP